MSASARRLLSNRVRRPPVPSALGVCSALLALLAGGCTPVTTASTGSSPTAPSATSSSTPTTAPPPSTVPPPTTSAPPAGTSGSLSLLVEPAAGYGFVSSIIDGATRSVVLAMYELTDAGVEQALAQAAGRGVSVEVLLDRNLEQSANEAAYGYLGAHGVHVHWGPSGVTVHEKVLCVDGDVCDVMTGNLTPQYYAGTRDFVVVDRLPSDVAAITATFASDFSGATPGAGSPGVDLVWSPGSKPALVGLIDGARRTLLVENEEMDSDDIVSALEQAARRGVDVELVMTEDAEWDDAFEALVAAGVHVLTYEADAPLYIHAKVIVADAASAFVGSENFSDASMDYNRELGLITNDAPVVSALTAQLQADAAAATAWPAG